MLPHQSLIVVFQFHILPLGIIVWQLPGGHCHWAPRQAGSKIPNLQSWEVQLFLQQTPSRSPEWGLTAEEPLQTVLHSQDTISSQGHTDWAQSWKCHPGRD